MSRVKTLIFSILAIIIGGFLIFRTFQSRPLSSPQSVKPLDDQNITLDASTDSSSTSPPAFSLLEEANLFLQASVSSLLSRINQLEQSQTSDPAIGATTTTSTTPTIVFQPQTIYLGSANTIKHEWTNTGTQVSLNTADYPAAVNAVFEAGLSIVGGEAWARLINQTTGAVMSITEVFHNNSNITWKTSPSFKLHSGYNTYEVQLKSTSGETANLSGARLKISL